MGRISPGSRSEGGSELLVWDMKERQAACGE
jgi:hypothetical protein